MKFLLNGREIILQRSFKAQIAKIGWVISSGGAAQNMKIFWKKKLIVKYTLPPQIHICLKKRLRKINRMRGYQRIYELLELSGFIKTSTSPFVTL